MRAGCESPGAPRRAVCRLRSSCRNRELGTSHTLLDLWPPFCMVVDWVVAAIISGEIAAGVHFG
jgi:hypothetical protein